ncbi:DUF2510 domain-containing protein [Antiquaquibacter soli]|uniref:DUF2510 domain-containing protein n=1 Tax=Antiquaquibacter soli TaxID=3064523 RepID=A0ABT9BNU5_9MICO|nr:DUF2510 domain-containing protein [Protaetiibacter sp. WY-16]MDO7882690.1 DUF2510 domain-containing protein [Protaetiibacter sp. WY-16]
MDDNSFGVPAGWYPDPLGLPQLRWWDSQAWTEHTSEARAPIIIQPSTTSTRLGFADDDLPSRREQRERERRQSGFTFESQYADPFADEFESPLDSVLDTETEPEREELSAQPLLAMTLKELEPPLTDTVEDVMPGPRRASSHANAAPAASTLSALAEEEAPERVANNMRSYTAAVWVIALMPAIQLVLSTILVLSGLGSNTALFVLLALGPYFLSIFIAAFDRLVLLVWGHKRPASAWWALLPSPAYLLVRAIRTYRETGKGFAPLAAWAAAVTSVFAGFLVLPGLIIAMLPGVFAAEAANSVEAQALGLSGASIEVTCPTPPMVIGDQFTCTRVAADGTTDSVVVELARRNGWIAWDVVDWGNTVVK